MICSYYINLDRRTDRDKHFRDNYNFSDIPVLRISAVNGCSENGCSENTKHVSENTNEYQNNLCIKSTIQSHVNAWIAFANSNYDYGIIFEDDVNFRPNNSITKETINELSRLDQISVVYLGAGDLLPIHTDVPNESMLRAQEKSHAIPITGHKYFGRPNTKSAYIFNWFGAFAYLLNKQTVNFLLDESLKNPINKAVDVWIKEKLVSKYVHIPLLTWHPRIDAENYDSDITPKFTPKFTPKLFFGKSSHLK